MYADGVLYITETFLNCFKPIWAYNGGDRDVRRTKVQRNLDV